MTTQEFDAHVLAHIRKYVAEGDVQATVSAEFAQLWLEADDSLNPQVSRISTINSYPGWSDDSGTLTYRLDPALNGLKVLIRTNPLSYGDALVMNVADSLFT